MCIVLKYISAYVKELAFSTCTSVKLGNADPDSVDKLMQRPDPDSKQRVQVQNNLNRNFWYC